MDGETIERALAPYLARVSPETLVSAKMALWLDGRQADVRAGDLSPTYLRELMRYARAGGEFSFWDGRPIYGIETGDLIDWNRWLAKRGLSPKTRHNVLGAFRTFLRWLLMRGDLEAVPRFPEVRVPEYAPTILTLEQQDLVLDQIPWERRGAFLAAARLGLRPGEIRALDLDDYQEGRLRVARAIQGPNSKAPTGPTKTRSATWIPVFDDELRAWIEWRLRYVAAEDRLRGRVALFPNPSARNREQRWISNAVREEWKRAAERVGLRVKMYEGTKHTLATNLLERGATMDVVQALLRHRDRRSTERYAKLDIGAAVRALPRHKSETICGPLVAGADPASVTARIIDENWRGGRDSNPQLPA